MMFEELDSLITGATNVLITSHISPDGDSVSSSLLLYKILKENYADKNIVVSMEEHAFGLDFLSDYRNIVFTPLAEALDTYRPDLLFILDANAMMRVTRDLESTSAKLTELTPKIVVIDHHEGRDIQPTDFYYNQSSPAVTLDIYQIFLEELSLRKPNDYAQVALTGLYTDTGGFAYQNLNFEKTFEVVPKLINDGADIEKIVAHLNSIKPESLKMLSAILENVEYGTGYSYSFIPDELSKPENHEALIQATDIFRTQFLRNVADRPWGFIVYRDVAVSEGLYSVSMRALSGSQDVSKIAKLLGGGGHKPAAGAKFQAQNVQEAVKKVLLAIEQNTSS